MIHKAMIYPKFWAHSNYYYYYIFLKSRGHKIMSVYHRLWRKALGHEVIIYPNFWGQNSKIIFKSKRAQDHEYVIGFIEKL